jgi:hypothetical protein
MLIDEEIDKRINSPLQLLLLLFVVFGIVLSPIAFGVYMTAIGYKLMGEIILGSTGMLFNLFLLSSLYDSNTVIPISSSIPYATLLFIRIISYAMVGLYIPAFVSIISNTSSKV